MTVTEITEKIQHGVLKTVETSQAATLTVLRSTATALDAIKPDTSSLPFAKVIPATAETLDVSFDYLGKVFDAQQSFLSGIFDAYNAPRTTVVAAKKS